MQGRINNDAKHFILEQTLRILPSKNKLLKMNRLETPGSDGTNICVQCNVLSDSSHQIAYCIFPTYAIHALNNLPNWKEKLPATKLNTLILEFQTRINSIQDSKLKHQTDLVLLAINRQGFEFWRDPIFYRMSAGRMHVLLVRTLKNLSE